MSKFWQKTIFWENVKRTLATFSGPTMVGLHEYGTADKWMIIAGGIGMVGGIISIWMTDPNNNGVVDIFEDKP